MIAPEKDGTLLLPATLAEIYGGEQIRLESEFNNIGWWSDAGDYVAWTIELQKPGDFDLHFDYACANARRGQQLCAGG